MWWDEGEGPTKLFLSGGFGVFVGVSLIPCYSSKWGSTYQRIGFFALVSHHIYYVSGHNPKWMLLRGFAGGMLSPTGTQWISVHSKKKYYCGNKSTGWTGRSGFCSSKSDTTMLSKLYICYINNISGSLRCILDSLIPFLLQLRIYIVRNCSLHVTCREVYI